MNTATLLKSFFLKKNSCFNSCLKYCVISYLLLDILLNLFLLTIVYFWFYKLFFLHLKTVTLHSYLLLQFLRKQKFLYVSYFTSLKRHVWKLNLNLFSSTFKYMAWSYWYKMTMVAQFNSMAFKTKIVEAEFFNLAK